ncbi:MAG: glycosyltransferase family 39 protein [Candidatus Methylopumilus sp.]
MTSNLYKRLSYALFGALSIFILLTFKQYGISNDEQVQHVYGQLLLKFYSSGFVDQSAFSYKNLYLYGGFFDLIAASLEKILPIWVWDIRHFISALFGLAGIVAVYKITEKLAGERAAFLAALLLTLTGAWSGAMFTHTKDVSFGACMTWALYYTSCIANQLDRIPRKLSIKLGIAIGCALGLRIGGAFAVIYLLLLVLIASLIQAPSIKEKLRFYGLAFVGLLPAGLVAFVLMALFWPWAMMGADHILIAAKSFSHFAFDMNTIVDGTFVNIGKVSRSYLLEYLAIRLPEVFLIGILSAIIVLLISMPSKIKPGAGFLKGKLPEISLAIAILFPLVFVLYDRPALYNGVRHFTFIIPPLAVLAGIGLSKAYDYLSAYPKWRWGFILLSSALALNTSYIMFELRPYEYVYYNHFAGKNLQQAEHHWEADYWSSSLIDASKMLENYLDAEQKHWPSEHQGPYFVAVCAEAFQGRAYLDQRFNVTENWIRADFFISSTHMNCDKVLNGNIIGTVARLGAPLAVVKDRRNLTGEDRLPHAAPQN